MGTAGAVANGPDIGGGGPECVINLDISTVGEFHSGESRPMPAVLGVRPVATRRCVPSTVLSVPSECVELYYLARFSFNAAGHARPTDVDAFVAEQVWRASETSSSSRGRDAGCAR